MESLPARRCRQSLDLASRRNRERFLFPPLSFLLGRRAKSKGRSRSESKSCCRGESEVNDGRGHASEKEKGERGKTRRAKGKVVELSRM